jgi:hypothetical protein
LAYSRLSGKQPEIINTFIMTITHNTVACAALWIAFSSAIHSQAAPPKNQAAAEDNSAARCCGVDLRTILGFEQAGAANSNSNQTYFFDFFLSQPIPITYARRGGDGDDKQGPRLRYFGEVRLTSTPQQISSSLAEFTTSFSQLVGQLKPNQLAQSAEYLGGFGYRLTSFRNPFLGGDGAKHRLGMYALAMAGATGFIGAPPSPQIYEAPKESDPQARLFKALFPTAPLSPTGTSGTKYIGFVEKDSARYRKQFFSGLRVVSHYEGESSSRAAARLDFLGGWNEAVTGGGLNGAVVRVEGFYPFSLGGGNKMTNVIYFYGSMQLAMSSPFDTFHLDSVRRDYGADRLFLNPALDTLASNPNVTIVNTNPLNRDFYRIGVGMDFLRLLQNYKESTGKTVARLDAIAGNNQTVIVGTKARTGLRIKVTDDSGLDVVGAKVTWTSSKEAGKASCTFPNGGTEYSNTTSASGLMEVSCTANTVEGAHKVTAEANSKTVEFSITNAALQDAGLELAGDGQTAKIDTAFPVKLAVRAKDGTAPVAGLNVVFSVDSTRANFEGGTSVSGQSTVTRTTDADGIAEAPVLKAAKMPGAAQVKVEAGGVKKNFNLTITQ